MIQKYNKLVRNKIPEIIQKNGDVPKIMILDEAQYFSALNTKLQEEIAEYLEDYRADELADILEVIYAIVRHKGLTVDDLEMLRAKKLEERGDFSNKVLLLEVERKH